MGHCHFRWAEEGFWRVDLGGELREGAGRNVLERSDAESCGAKGSGCTGVADAD